MDGWMESNSTSVNAALPVEHVLYQRIRSSFIHFFVGAFLPKHMIKIEPVLQKQQGGHIIYLAETFEQFNCFGRQHMQVTKIYTCSMYWERSTASFLSFTVTHASVNVVTTSASPLLHSLWVRGLFLTHTVIRCCLSCLQVTQSNHAKEENAVWLTQPISAAVVREMVCPVFKK